MIYEMTNDPRTDTRFFTERLIQSLSELHRYPMTVVQAPMGYGKTVAVREFLKNSTMQVAWVSLYGESELLFWRDLCRELHRKFPHCAELVQSLAQLGVPSDTVLIDEAMQLFSQFTCKQETVLVIDDYHYINTIENAAFIERLIQSPPEQFHVVLITRNAYAGNQELLRLKGFLHMVGQEAFALTQQEIQAYYQLCNLPITEEDAKILHHNTDGWISALYLYMLHYAKKGEISLPTSIYELVDYEVYSLLSEETHEFLMRICPYERFTFEQAAYVWGREDTSVIMRELCHKNAFISYEEPTRLFHIHAIFHAFILKRFERLPVSRKREVYRLSGDWFLRDGIENDGDLSLAIDAYYAAGDFEQVMVAVEADRGNSLTTDRRELMVRIFQQCPESIREAHIIAVFIFAIFSFTVNDFATVAQDCAWIERHLDTMEDSESNALRGELEFLYSLLAYNDIETMSKHHKRALELIQGPTIMFATDSPWTLGSPSVLYMFHRTSGALARELELMRDCMPIYSALSSNHGAGGELLMEAETLFFAGEYERAEIMSYQAETVAMGHRQVGNVVCARFLQARVHCFRGDFTKAMEAMSELRDMLKEKRDFYLMHTIDLCEGFLFAQCGHAEHVPEWIRTGMLGESRLFVFAYGVYYIVHCHVLLLSGDYRKAIGVVTAMLESSNFQMNLLFEIYGHITIASAYQMLCDYEAAAEALRCALNLALPDQLYMPFVEHSAMLRPALEALLHDEVLGAGVKKICALANEWDKSRKRIANAYFAESGSTLTRREKEIVHITLSGRSNREIAEMLHIAESTVKRALVVIYRKLGIDNREALRQVANIDEL